MGGKHTLERFLYAFVPQKSGPGRGHGNARAICQNHGAGQNQANCLIMTATISRNAMATF